MKIRCGDTLIEVALAIGVFSLVAITVVSVVSGSLTGAQASLEVTLAREELDAQAEALRFVHESYVSGSQSKDTSKNNYAALWKKITDLATKVDTDANARGAIEYNPTACSELYPRKDGDIDASKTGNVTPFIINTRQLGDPNNQIILKNGTDRVFYPAATYPRVLYGNDPNKEVYSLEEEANYSNSYLARSEGIFIIAVKGNSEIVVDATNTQPNQVTNNKTAYYDFYIRSCWMPLNSDRASTISTVVRLYDPAIIDY